MAKQYFVLGIGGTGMRCIESLVHLCAMGMFDDTDLHLLALDTDKDNGNFKRLKDLKEAYLGVKGLPENKRAAHSETFFSANIKYYQFSPNYEDKCSFKVVFHYDDAAERNTEQRQTDLADLVFTNDVEEFNLRHGYRAQTHLGSMMMYRSIVEAAKDERSSDLKKFLQSLISVCEEGSSPRLFILGSVFGGTGASSIPVIPKALSDAVTSLSRGNINLYRSAYFGSTLLTSYFTFKLPSDTEQKNQKIVASSDKFALNSQAAMMFYNDDTTVKQTYQRFYMMGTTEMKWDVQSKKKENETITGGKEQENPSHYIELLAACAAWDFFQMPEDELKTNKEHKKTDYCYRSIDDNGILEFQDFVDKDKAETFGKKFGLLLAFSLFNNTEDDFVAAMQSGKQGMNDFEDMAVEQVNALKAYFEMFHLKIEKDGSLTDGWLRQIYRSAEQGEKFVFNSEMFAATNYKELYNTHWSDKLYKPTCICKDHSYGDAKTLLGYNKSLRFNAFKKLFIEVNKNKNSIPNRGEQLIKEIYDTLVKLYKFN